MAECLSGSASARETGSVGACQGHSRRQEHGTIAPRVPLDAEKVVVICVCTAEACKTRMSHVYIWKISNNRIPVGIVV